ncbi:MAG: hypothetical protein IJV17_00315 [Prevotella sp.]|nr:hypothetical protein [Prevotella sp.]
MRLKTTIFLLPLFLTVGCSTIDDDLSDCGNDFQLDYEMRLVTNVTTELTTKLNTTTDVNVANALRTHLRDIFTDFAHDVDLSFYDTENSKERLSHDQHVMNASEQSYTIYLPMREYMHLAVANIGENQVVDLRDDEHCPTARLTTTAVKDTIGSHATGLFTARQPMEVLEGVDQTFHVRLYMANCAAALVIDPRGHDTKEMKAFTTGFASQFNINDSVYVFAEKSPIVRTAKLTTDGDELCFCSVNFPSSEDEMRTVIETEEPFSKDVSGATFWQFRVYVEQPDATITETILNVKEPLRAGQMKIIKGWINENGSIQTSLQEVVTSVTLDWKDGGHYNPEI